MPIARKTIAHQMTRRYCSHSRLCSRVISRVSDARASKEKRSEREREKSASRREPSIMERTTENRPEKCGFSLVDHKFVWIRLRNIITERKLSRSCTYQMIVDISCGSPFGLIKRCNLGESSYASLKSSASHLRDRINIIPERYVTSAF